MMSAVTSETSAHITITSSNFVKLTSLTKYTAEISNKIHTKATETTVTEITKIKGNVKKTEQSTNSLHLKSFQE